jgi:hypothetical protein
MDVVHTLWSVARRELRRLRRPRSDPIVVDPGSVPPAAVMVRDIVHVDERDYRFGSGPLTLRVTAVGPVQHTDDGLWINVRGMELRRDGSPVGPTPRYALMRMSALPSRRR